MNIEIGGQQLIDVQIPILWGTRAILQDKKGRISVLDLSGERARAEILGDAPAPGVEYSLTTDGAVIVMEGDRSLYEFDPDQASLTAIDLDLPPCRICEDSIKVGEGTFAGNTVFGFGVGIAVFENGRIAMGTPVPDNLARLVV